MHLNDFLCSIYNGNAQYLLQTCITMPCHKKSNYSFHSAMFGTAPPAVEASLRNYCLYYSSIIELEFSSKHKKPVKSTSKEVFGLFKEFLYLVVKLGMIYSIVEKYGYAPFGKSQSIFELRHIVNNFFVACELRLSLQLVELHPNNFCK